MVQPSTATRTSPTTLEVKVHDKQAGARFATIRAEMLLRPGERIKLVKKRYPFYMYEIRSKNDGKA